MRYQFVLTGRTALLMHFDDVQWSDEIGAWRLAPENKPKKGEGRGDDRRPAHTWIGYCYHDGKQLAIPSCNLASCLKKAGSRVPNNRGTFKELAVSGIWFEQEHLSFTNSGQAIPLAPIQKLIKEPCFNDHAEAVADMGFKLDVRRAVVGAAKHVRVRPRFESWTASGTLEVTSDHIDPETLDQIFIQAGRVGLGDWRPGSPKSPGVFGMFGAQLKPIK